MIFTLPLLELSDITFKGTMRTNSPIYALTMQMLGIVKNSLKFLLHEGESKNKKANSL